MLSTMHTACAGVRKMPLKVWNILQESSVRYVVLCACPGNRGRKRLRA